MPQEQTSNATPALINRFTAEAQPVAGAQPPPTPSVTSQARGHSTATAQAGHTGDHRDEYQDLPLE